MGRGRRGSPWPDYRRLRSMEEAQTLRSRPDGANSTFISSNIATGIGTISPRFSLGCQSFRYSLSVPNVFPQQDDYVHISVGLSDPTQLIQMLIILFNDRAGRQQL